MGPQARPARLYLLELAVEHMNYGKYPIEMVLPAYLVQMDDGANVLIDTAMPVDFTSPLVPTPAPGRNLLDQLALIGVAPDNINQVICSHFDIDHAGQNDAFPNAEFIVQREHDALARAGCERLQTIRDHWDQPTLHYRLVDGDTTLHPGLDLIETGGHVPGHQSVLVRLPETGSVLLAIDAVALERFFTPEHELGPYDEDLDQLRASTVKLIDLAAREGGALVVFGHDGEQWQTLRKAPDFYA